MAKRLAFLLCMLASLSALSLAQTETATLSGRITDASGAIIVDAEVKAMNIDTGIARVTTTNKEGVYVLPSLPPGRYRLSAKKEGFSQVVKTEIVLHLQDTLGENFILQVGSVSESVTVRADSVNVNTTDASVSTVVDQSYVQNMPLNGRSFQDLILLTPGVVTQTPQSSFAINGLSSLGQTGEFSVNGQRAEENYYTVDGVSGNLGGAPGSNLTGGAGASGSIGAATVLGTTQALVSVDDLQEFRVQSSTYSAEYGRNPGGQFAFETKSGTNQWHGTAYDYLRNDYVDATDWFNNYLNVKEPPLRQNDFGGTLGGPVQIPGLYNGKDKTFFFFSYEGLRLIQPQPASLLAVPDLCFRGAARCTGGNTAAPAPLQPVLKAFPLPNQPDIGDSWAEFKGSWSNPSSLDSTSVRFDHVLNDKMRLFFRFSNTSSTLGLRQTTVSGFGAPPSNNQISGATTRTYTGGATSLLTNRLSNEFRINYSSNETTSKLFFDAFAGSIPVNLAQLTGLGSSSFEYVAFCYDTFCMQPTQSQGAISIQKQWNLVDTVSYSIGRHELKFGVDYRRLSSYATDSNPEVSYFYGDPTSVQSNNPSFSQVVTVSRAYPLYKNFSAFAEDQWKATQNLTLALGLRWELNPPPGVTQGVMPYTIQGSSSASLALAPQGTPLWTTAWYNFAPRIGVAYSIHGQQGWETVVRGGGGVFYDTGQQMGSQGFNGPGFQAIYSPPTGFPFPTVPQVPVVSNPPECCPYLSSPWGFAKHLQLPYTLQWNASVQQELGRSQALTLSYVGSHAARLLREDVVNTPPANANSTQFFFTSNGLTSDYDSMQLQFQRRLSGGLTALASYTWSHCIDYGSQNYYLGYQRGDCDFDVRHNVSGAFSYDVPNLGSNGFLKALIHHWGVDERFIARTAFPVTLDGGTFIDPATGKQLHSGLDLIANQPLYIYGSACTAIYNNGLSCPGGQAINPGAFAPVPADPTTGQPTRLGTAPRNLVRGFGAWQMSLAIRREFPIYERLTLQFRAEAFNVFNHPNFGTIFPIYCMPNPASNNGCTFGQATNTLATSLGTTLSSLYQMGGPRSMQFALKLIF